MNIKFSLSLLLTISSFAFSMQKDGMTVLKKSEEARPFAGRIVAVKVPWQGWNDGYVLHDKDMRYAYISLQDYILLGEEQEGYPIKEHYHLLHVLEYTNLLKSYWSALTTHTLAQENFSLRLANIQELKQVLSDIVTDKALFKVGLNGKELAQEIVTRNLWLLAASQQ